MKNKRQSIRELAVEADLTVDEVLLRLWETGVNGVTRPSDCLTGDNLKSARQALGIPTRREIVRPEYWQNRLDVTSEGFAFLLKSLGMSIRPGTNSLPKGAIARLKAELRLRKKPPTPKFRPAIEVTSEKNKSSQAPPWQQVGHERELRMLTYDELIRIHQALVQHFTDHHDPITPSGVRNESLLGSAIGRPHTSLNGIYKYPTVEMAGAALTHALVHNHPFHNGNKRTALVAMLVFLDENAMMLTCDEDELFQFVLQVAKHRIVDPCSNNLADHEVWAMAHWVHDNSRFVAKGEHTIPFRELRPILTGYDCTFEFPSGAGNRINITRTVEERVWLGWRKRNVILRTQIFYGDEGRDVDKSCMKKIRTDLHLDDAHNVDSRAFYESTPASPEGFIADYRKTLQRLARL